MPSYLCPVPCCSHLLGLGLRVGSAPAGAQLLHAARCPSFLRVRPQHVRRPAHQPAARDHGLHGLPLRSRLHGQLVARRAQVPRAPGGEEVRRLPRATQHGTAQHAVCRKASAAPYPHPPTHAVCARTALQPCACTWRCQTVTAAECSCMQACRHHAARTSSAPVGVAAWGVGACSMVGVEPHAGGR